MLSAGDKVLVAAKVKRLRSENEAHQSLQRFLVKRCHTPASPNGSTPFGFIQQHNPISGLVVSQTGGRLRRGLRRVNMLFVPRGPHYQIDCAANCLHTAYRTKGKQ